MLPWKPHWQFKCWSYQAGGNSSGKCVFVFAVLDRLPSLLVYLQTSCRLVRWIKWGWGEKNHFWVCPARSSPVNVMAHVGWKRFQRLLLKTPRSKQCNYSSTTTFEMHRCPSPVRKVHVFQLVSFAACGISLAFSESIDWIYCWVNHNINICSWGAWLEKYLLCWAEQRLLPELLCTALGEAGFQTDVTDTAGKTDRLLGTA